VSGCHPASAFVNAELSSLFFGSFILMGQTVIADPSFSLDLAADQAWSSLAM
jgi:hypothetical protein